MENNWGEYHGKIYFLKSKNVKMIITYIFEGLLDKILG